MKNDSNYARIMGLITLAIPASPWSALKAHALGDCARPTLPPSGATLYYECTTAGTSAATEPQWPATPGSTVGDGSVVWTCRDASYCSSFGDLAFRYSDPGKATQNISTPEFVRLLRFIRLWKKLGWTIEQTDAAVCALFRTDLGQLGASDTDDVAKLNNGFLTLLPRLGIVIRVIGALNLTLNRELLPLLACWSDIGTHGDTALYRQMFLNPPLLKQDAVFADNGYGEFLVDDPLHPKKIAEHVEALRAAFNLTGEELSLIAADLGFKILLAVSYKHPQPTLEQAILDAAPGIGYDDLRKQLFYAGVLSLPTRDALKAVAGVSAEFQAAVDALFAANPTLTALTIPNISAVYRRGWLSRKLRLSVRELLLLIHCTGLDPFAAPDPPDPSKNREIAPILRLLRVVEALGAASLKPVQALYLLWNKDLSGKSAPDDGQIAALARALRAGCAEIENQFVVVDDPTGEITRVRMGQAYGTDATDFFFGLLKNTFTVDVPYSHPQPILEPSIVEKAAGRMAYDDFRKRLSYSGVLLLISAAARP